MLSNASHSLCISAMLLSRGPDPYSAACAMVDLAYRTRVADICGCSLVEF